MSLGRVSLTSKKFRFGAKELGQTIARSREQHANGAVRATHSLGDLWCRESLQLIKPQYLFIITWKPLHCRIDETLQLVSTRCPADSSGCSRESFKEFYIGFVAGDRTNAVAGRRPLFAFKLSDCVAQIIVTNSPQPAYERFRFPRCKRADSQERFQKSHLNNVIGIHQAAVLRSNPNLQFGMQLNTDLLQQ